MKINQDIMSTYILISNFMKINKDIYFNIKLHENKIGQYCNLGNDWDYRVPIFLPLRQALSVLFLDDNLASSSVSEMCTFV